jgi:hypothetical protein
MSQECKSHFFMSQHNEFRLVAQVKAGSIKVWAEILHALNNRQPFAFGDGLVVAIGGGQRLACVGNNMIRRSLLMVCQNNPPPNDNARVVGLQDEQPGKVGAGEGGRVCEVLFEQLKGLSVFMAPNKGSVVLEQSGKRCSLGREVGHVAAIVTAESKKGMEQGNVHGRVEIFHTLDLLGSERPPAASITWPRKSVLQRARMDFFGWTHEGWQQ